MSIDSWHHWCTPTRAGCWFNFAQACETLRHVNFCPCFPVLWVLIMITMVWVLGCCYHWKASDGACSGALMHCIVPSKLDGCTHLISLTWMAGWAVSPCVVSPTLRCNCALCTVLPCVHLELYSIEVTEQCLTAGWCAVPQLV